MISIVSSENSDSVDKNSKNNNKNEKMDLGRSLLFTNKNNNYKIGTPNTLKTIGIMKESNITSNNINDNKFKPINSHKSHTITISGKEENKNFGRTYISSIARPLQRNKSNEKSNIDNNNSNKNIKKVFIFNSAINKTNDSSKNDNFDNSKNINNNAKSIQSEQRKNLNIYISGSNENKCNKNKNDINNKKQNISNNTKITASLNDISNKSNIISNPSKILNNVNTIFISESKKHQNKDNYIDYISKNNKKDNKARGTKKTSEIYYSSNLPSFKNDGKDENINNDIKKQKEIKEVKPLKYSTNNNVNTVFISTKNISTKKDDFKDNSKNKPIIHNTQIYVSAKTKKEEKKQEITNINQIDTNSTNKTRISPKINKYDNKSISNDINRILMNSNSKNDSINKQSEIPSTVGNIYINNYSSKNIDKDIEQHKNNFNNNVKANSYIKQNDNSEFNLIKDNIIKENYSKIERAEELTVFVDKDNIEKNNKKGGSANYKEEEIKKKQEEVNNDKINNKENNIELDKRENLEENNNAIHEKKDEIKTENALAETKIMNKFSFLDFNTPFLNDFNLDLHLNTTENDKKKEQSGYDTFSFLNNSELSIYTKAYLGTYSSGPRPELSDYTKAYLNSITTSTSNVRPELSNLTKEYLSSHLSEFNNNKSKKD